MILEVRTVGDPILKEPCEPIPLEELCAGNIDIHALVLDMVDTIIDAGGIGLAANQIGISKRLIVTLPIEGRYLSMVNPELISAKKWRTGIEGCLSIPGKQYKIERATEIEVKFFNLCGEERQFVISEELFAWAIQHELDHLDGILVCDNGEEME
jgi:peptide deformylase